MLDTFFEKGGSFAILKMTNFIPECLHKLHADVSDEISLKYNVGHRKKIKIMDFLILKINVLKLGAQLYSNQEWSI